MKEESWGPKTSFGDWKTEYETHIGIDKPIHNRSGIENKPIYTSNDWDSRQYDEELGYPGFLPMTRGIYPTMHRGRRWTQRQLIGLGTPEDYNQRLKRLLASGATAISILPCNSGFRGFDCDEVDPLLLGTCGTIVNNVNDLQNCFNDIPIDRLSIGLNDPAPFTMLGFLLGVASRRGISLSKIVGTSNQSDYISHFVANHMFFRLALPGSKRLFLDTVEFCREKLPGWNPISVVGQHMQQAGATPAETMAFTLSTAIQYTNDCIERGMDPDSFLHRLTFFFDISISFFEEIAKFRAGRRLWARITKERFGAKDPRSYRFKFHGQTSGVDLTQQSPLNNIARVAVQAVAGIFSGLQSMHSDAYDEATCCPTEEAAMVAVATQNILREEAHLCDVIDPLGGSFYIEKLTNEMEEKIVSIIEQIDAVGGMYHAVESGMIQHMIGQSAYAFQEKIDSGAHKIVGVNAYQEGNASTVQIPLKRPDLESIKAHIRKFETFKKERNQSQVDASLDKLSTAAQSDTENVFEKVVNAAQNDATHSEIISRLRSDLGFGKPLVIP